MTDKRRFDPFDFDVEIARKYVTLALIKHELHPENKVLSFEYDRSIGVYIDDAALKHIFEMLRSCKKDIEVLDFSNNAIKLDRLEISMSFTDKSFYSCFYEHSFLKQIKIFDFTDNPLLEKSQDYLMKFLTSVNMPDQSKVKVYYDYQPNDPYEYIVNFRAGKHMDMPDTMLCVEHTQPYMIVGSFKSVTD